MSSTLAPYISHLGGSCFLFLLLNKPQILKSTQPHPYANIKRIFKRAKTLYKYKHYTLIFTAFHNT